VDHLRTGRQVKLNYKRRPNTYQARAVNREKEICCGNFLFPLARPRNGNSDLVYGLQLDLKQPAKHLFELNR
jgi:hypothetical protein